MEDEVGDLKERLKRQPKRNNDLAITNEGLTEDNKNGQQRISARG